MDIVKRQEIFQVYKDLPISDLVGPAGSADLDPLPSVLSPEEIPFLSAAADQWGRLLTAVYRDLWGPQTMVSSGALEAGFLWRDLGFDPGFHGVVPPEVDPLSLIRLDLIRSSGTWYLTGLGTEVPQGLGTALETRINHGRLFGTRVPHDNLVRLAPFFQGLKDLWFGASRTHRDEPSIMVWTSGPSDPAYAEPVYLSRYFGYPLVESRDLTVRSGKVFLKTLGGLKPVDVLVRMVPDRAFDPLTGNPGGYGGVAGLTQAVRDGTVLVTNAPGAGLLGRRELLPHYGDLCRRVLGEDLLLGPGSGSPAAGTEDFLDADAWTPAPVMYRLFAAGGGPGWNLMPGGVVQTLTEPVTKKDLWFLSSQAVAPVTLLPTGERPSEINRGGELPSRVADDLFWLGRYTERAWVDLRFLEKRGETRLPFLDDLVRTLGILPEDSGEEAGWKGSRLAETVLSVQQISGQLLDRLSLETHRILKELGQIPADGGPSLPETLRQLNLRLAAFSGLTMESMTRSPGWLFLDMGRRLERALLLVESLRAAFSLPGGEGHLALLLDVFDSTLTYRTRYRLSPQRGPVLDLLLLDETNPRSLAFQVETLGRHVGQLPRPGQRPFRTVEERAVLDLTTRIRLTDGTALIAGVLEPFLDGLTDRLETFGQALHQTYLAKIDVSDALQARTGGETK